MSAQQYYALVERITTLEVGLDLLRTELAELKTALGEASVQAEQENTDELAAVLAQTERKRK